MNEDERAILFARAKVQELEQKLAWMRAYHSHIPWRPTQTVISREELQELGLVGDDLCLKNAVPVRNLMDDLRRMFNERD